MVKNKTKIIAPKLQQKVTPADTLETFNILTPQFLRHLKYIATIQSIGSSTRLAGSKLSNKEVEALLLRFRTQSFKNQR